MLDKTNLMRISMQFFADEIGDTETEDVVDLEDTTVDDTTAEESPAETHEEPQQEPTEQRFKVKYNGQEQELTVDELIANAQKGMNYDHVRGDLEKERKTRAELETKANKYREAVTAFGYQGEDDDIITQMMAQAQQITPEEYRAQQDAQRRQLEELLTNDPRYQRMVEVEKEQAVTIAMINDLAAIKSAFPTETATDLDKIQNSDKYLEYICKGIPAVEAYKLANFDSLSGKKSKPKTGEDKEHFIKTGGAGGVSSDVEVPASALGIWREMFPDDTPAQLKERYNKTMK